MNNFDKRTVFDLTISQIICRYIVRFLNTIIIILPPILIVWQPVMGILTSLILLISSYYLLKKIPIDTNFHILSLLINLTIKYLHKILIAFPSKIPGLSTASFQAFFLS